MTKQVRVHFYFGPLCRSEIIDYNKPFNLNRQDILNLFGINNDNHDNYVLKLMNGGVVEKNEVLFHDDRVMILPREGNIKNEQPEQDEDLNDQGNQALLENINNIHLKDFHQIFRTYKEQQESTQIKTEQDQEQQIKGERKTAGSDKIKYKSLLKKKSKREDDENNKMVIEETMDDGNNGKLWTDENLIKKIDYDNLEVILYKKQITDYHQLIDLVNVWAINLGFLVKLKRSPKLNADGSQTLRLYCSSYKRSEPLDNQYKLNCCTFAMTFKQDERTACWLMYQEFSKDCMSHTHKLDKKRYDSIRQYIADYHDKVRTLSELKDLIYEKFGLEYTLNQIHYFKGKWLGEAVIVEKDHFEDDSLNFYKLLKKNPDDFLEVEFDANDKINLQFIFYSNSKMKEQYLKNNDVIFINKRFTQNRFKRPLILFFAISNTGKSILIAIALIEKEEIYYFSKVAQAFLKHMHNVQPQTLIIERQLKMYQALKDNLPLTNILFCYFHIQRTFKQQYAFLEKEKPEDYQKIIDLPIIENEDIFEQQLADVNKLTFINEYHKLILQKLTAEKKLWPKCSHLKYFTAGISVCQRNEQIKTYLKPALKKRESAISEAVKRLMTIDQKEFKLSHEYQKVSQKHEQVFKQALFLNTYVKDMCSSYAYQRVKWNIARGFRYEIKDDREDEFVLQLKPSNSAIKKLWHQGAIRVKKIVNQEGQKGGKCECFENIHSGFPCPHLCLLNYKGKIQYLDVNPRWQKSKDSKMKQEQQEQKPKAKRSTKKVINFFEDQQMEDIQKNENNEKNQQVQEEQLEKEKDQEEEQDQDQEQEQQHQEDNQQVEEQDQQEEDQEMQEEQQQEEQHQENEDQVQESQQQDEDMNNDQSDTELKQNPSQNDQNDQPKSAKSSQNSQQDEQIQKDQAKLIKPKKLQKESKNQESSEAETDDEQIISTKSKIKAEKSLIINPNKKISLKIQRLKLLIEK